MTALIAQLTYRLKAVLAGTFIALTGIAEWAVTDPNTAVALQAVIPTRYSMFVPVALGAIGTILVHQVSNRAPAASTAAVAVEEPNLNTVMLTIPNSGEFTGAGAQ